MVRGACPIPTELQPEVRHVVENRGRHVFASRHRV